MADWCLHETRLTIIHVRHNHTHYIKEPHKTIRSWTFSVYLICVWLLTTFACKWQSWPFIFTILVNSPFKSDCDCTTECEQTTFNIALSSTILSQLGVKQLLMGERNVLEKRYWVVQIRFMSICLWNLHDFIRQSRFGWICFHFN